jgi:hypothetical protein
MMTRKQRRLKRQGMVRLGGGVAASKGCREQEIDFVECYYRTGTVVRSTEDCLENLRARKNEISTG